MKHGILERIESNSQNSQKDSPWKPLRYISLGTRDKEGAKIIQEKEISRGTDRGVTG